MRHLYANTSEFAAAVFLALSHRSKIHASAILSLLSLDSCSSPVKFAGSPLVDLSPITRADQELGNRGEKLHPNPCPPCSVDPTGRKCIV
jgi:hypothetical protein